MNDSYFKKKSVEELINSYKYQHENKIVDKKWVVELMHHLKNRIITIEEFDLIKANFEQNDFINVMKNNISSDVKNIITEVNETDIVNKIDRNSNDSSSNLIGLYFLLIINTVILVFFLFKYFDAEAKINELQNNMNHIIH